MQRKDLTAGVDYAVSTYGRADLGSAVLVRATVTDVPVKGGIPVTSKDLRFDCKVDPRNIIGTWRDHLAERRRAAQARADRAQAHVDTAARRNDAILRLAAIAPGARVPFWATRADVKPHGDGSGVFGGDGKTDVEALLSLAEAAFRAGQQAGPDAPVPAPVAVCKHCHQPIVRESAGWVTTLSGDDGGTYDECEDNYNERTDTWGGHAPAK